MAAQDVQSNVDPTPACPTFDELVALADGQFVLYQQNPDGLALGLAIRHYCAALDLVPTPNTAVNYGTTYLRLCRALLLRAQTDDDSTNTVANKYLDKALQLTPPTHVLRPALLITQATSYVDRYQRTQDEADLHLGVQMFQTLMDTIPEAHPQRVHFLMQYGSALYKRHTALRDENDLDLSIQTFRAVLESCPNDLIITVRWFLALALDTRYQLHYKIDDLELTVKAYAAVVDMMLQQPKQYLFGCGRYAVVLGVRFYRKGDADDLHAAIRYAEIVVKMCPPSHQAYFTILVFYGDLLIDRSRQRASIQDIDTAIECLRNGMAAGCAEDPTRPRVLSTLGNCLASRFLHCGSVADLESAVEHCYDAVSLESSLDMGVRAGHLNHLAFSLFTRYQLQGDRMDATRAREFLDQALDLCPLTHSNRLPILNNYARILGDFGRKNSDANDLNTSIKLFYQALEHCYGAARSTLLSNLTMGLLHRHSQLRDPSDVDLAFSLSKTALELQPEDHPFRGRTFLFQAKAIIAMFPRKYTVVDTEVALDVLHAARRAFTTGHPLLIETYRELSHVYNLRYSVTQCSADLENAFKYRIEAAQYSNGGSQVQFEAAMQWVESGEEFHHPSLLDAYRFAIRILDLHLVLKPTLNLRHDIVKTQALSICADATSCALRRQDVIGAVEMFEHSRGLFWTFMARLRTPLDDLRASGAAGGELADEFENLSRQLVMPMTTGEDGENGQRFRRIQREWNAAVDKIRSVDGFVKFLLPPSYGDLRVAAVGGPVIILNASCYSCDAIIVLANAEPIHVPFREGTYAELVTLSSDYQLERHDARKVSGFLRRLWDSVVCDVVRCLEPHVLKHSRIWWCPTGKFTLLPIHAAHPYRKGESGLSDLYVSSYTPTLSALIRSRNRRHTPRGAPCFVSVGQPNSPGLTLLASVRPELDLVRQLVPASVLFTELSDEAATREAVLSALSTHTFAHLACHGQQEPQQPYQSHFAMGDGRLTLLDIVQRQAGHEAEFAFLSACKTATGDDAVPDEVIHLAAGLQFAGVRSVVGTMWSVDDGAVMHIVEAFYRAMVDDDGAFEPSRAARALRTATRVTKDRVPLDQRVVFVHIGV